MLFKEYSSLKPKPKALPPVIYGTVPTNNMRMTRPDWRDKNFAEKFNLSPEEVVRRDLVIRDLWQKCNAFKGMVVRCKHESDHEKYGKLTIRGVCNSIFDFKDGEWPKNDNPLIVTASPEIGGGEIFCTTNFFVLENHGGSC